MWSKRRTAWRLILDIMRCVLIWLLSCFALGCTLASHVIAIRHVVAALKMFRGHRTCSVATGRDHANAKCKSGLNAIAANFISDFNHLESSMTMRLSFWPVEVPLCVTWKSCAPPGAKACFMITVHACFMVTVHVCFVVLGCVRLCSVLLCCVGLLSFQTMLARRLTFPARHEQ